MSMMARCVRAPLTGRIYDRSRSPSGFDRVVFLLCGREESIYGVLGSTDSASDSISDFVALIREPEYLTFVANILQQIQLA
jgi:hypothetical protein